MPQSLTNFDAALKDDYGPGLRNAVNNSNPVFTEAMKNDTDIIGRQAVWTVHTGRSNSTGGRGELAALPAADRQRHTSMREDLAYLYHTIKVSGPAKHLTRNDTGAFTRALESEIDGAEKDLKNDVSRQVFNTTYAISATQYTGVLGVLTADPGTGTTITLAGASKPELRYFFSGMSVVFVDPATGTQRAGGAREVVSVAPATGVVTVATATDAAVASGDWVVRGDAGGNSLGKEMNGLRNLVHSTKVFAGVDPATVPSWGSVEVGSSTTAISETFLDELIEGVETDGDGSTPSLYITDHLQRRKLASMLQAQKRYEGRETTLKAGWRGLQIAQGTLVADRYCPTPDAFAITPKELTKFVGLDWSWDEDDSKVLYKALDGSDAVEARYKAYVNLVVTTRNAHAHGTLAVPAF